MRVAAVQYKPVKGRRDDALADLRRLVSEAAPGSDLVVLPEMAATGYLFPSDEAAGEVAEEPEGPTFQALAPLAAEHGAWLVAGFPERAGDRLYNSALVVDPAGELRFVYRKTLLFPPDHWWAEPGDSGYRAFDTDVGRFGIGICMDLNDDRFLRWMSSAVLDVLAFPANWIQEDADVWGYWAHRMRLSGAALVAANTYGPEGPVEFVGRSAILREDGEVLAHAGPTGEAVIRAVV